MFPCVSCGDPAGQVNATIAYLESQGAKPGRLWYDVEAYRWSSSLSANQQFIQGLVDKGMSMGMEAGIYSSASGWTEIVGHSWSYPSSKGLPLWYAHYDGKQDFSDFSSFGGWNAPAIKQYYGDKSSCGVGIDYNWAPSGPAPGPGPSPGPSPTSNQQWLGPNSATKGTILFKANTNKCLDLRGGSTANGPPIDVWDCNDSSNQQWTYDATTSAIRYTKDSSKCLDLAVAKVCRLKRWQVDKCAALQLLELVA